MRVVEIIVTPSTDGAIERVTISLERRRNMEYVVEDTVDVVAGTPEATRKLMIEDTDRIVITGQAAHTIVYDKEQMSATPEPIDKAAKAQKAVYDEEQKRIYEEANAEAEPKEAEPAKKTNLGNPVEPHEEPHNKATSPMGKQQAKPDPSHSRR